MFVLQREEQKPQIRLLFIGNAVVDAKKARGSSAIQAQDVARPTSVVSSPSRPRNVTNHQPATTIHDDFLKGASTPHPSNLRSALMIMKHELRKTLDGPCKKPLPVCTVKGPAQAKMRLKTPTYSPRPNSTT